MSRLRAAGALHIDAVLAVLAFAAGTAEVVSKRLEGPLALNLLGMAALTAPVAFRHRAPVAALCAFWAAAIAQSALLTPVPEFSTVFVVAVVMPYTVGAWEDGRRVVVAPALSVAGVVAVNVLNNQTLIGDFVVPAGAMVGSWLAGRTVHQRTRLAAELHEQAVRAQERREDEAREAAAEERRRIAREMHDVVAHGVSVMVVQAGGARRILDADPERARGAAEEIERAGAQALGELRRLLGVLRPEELDDCPDLAASPSLDQLDELLACARDAGLPVTLTVEGERRSTPIGMDLAAYRIVQEGLTNALKHAGRVPTEVRIAWTPDHVELVVSDRGPGPAAGRRRADDGGHGLIGMRERVRLYGGELETGRRRGGGFTVRARLPLDPLAQAAPEALAV